MVFSRLILGFIVFKEGKILDPKKVQAIMNTNPQQIQVFNGMVQFLDVLSRFFPLSWHQKIGRYK